MKKLIITLPALLLLTSCQPPVKQQYFEASPEIDVVKQGNQDYEKGDWETFRLLYHDTAKIADNTWAPGQFISVDQYIEEIKKGLEGFSECKISDDAFYCMIISDDGEKWVLNWFNWTAKTTDGKEVSVPVHIGLRFEGDKIVFQGNMYNQLPVFLHFKRLRMKRLNDWVPFFLNNVSICIKS